MTSNADELSTSIELYKSQLLQIGNSLEVCTSTEEKTSLEDLKTDLEELLRLTELELSSMLEQQQVSSSAAKVVSSINNENDQFTNEMEAFLKEIKHIEQNSDSVIKECNSRDSNDSMVDTEFDIIQKELNDLVGKKCIAPHVHSWGSKAYHNAFVCALGDSFDEENLQSIQVKVFFTNPTHREMLPCSYYLDGACKFDAENCRFSHGELVEFNELKEYVEPDFSLLNKSKLNVLAKQEDKLWYRGKTITTDFTNKTCTVKLEHNKKEILSHFEDILPIIPEDCSESDSDSEYDSSTDDCLSHGNVDDKISQNLFIQLPDQPLGEWEKYTTGFGSKIMKKFGYIYGTGLGNNGDGIITPISAQVLPPGRSLDHCMTLREQAGGDKDLFSVERKLKKHKRKQEQRNQKLYEREKEKTDLFTFINDKILQPEQFVNEPSTSTITSLNANTSKINITNLHTKKLNLASLQIDENIKRKQKDIDKIKESMLRHKNGSQQLYNKFKSQLNTMLMEMDNLKKSELNIANEQNFRKDKTKLTIF